MIPSCSSAAWISEEWGPDPIGLRETASAPMRRAATSALKPPPTCIPSSTAHTSPPGPGRVSPRTARSTRICPMRTTRPTPESVHEAGAGASGEAPSLVSSVSVASGVLVAGSLTARSANNSRAMDGRSRREVSSTWVSMAVSKASTPSTLPRIAPAIAPIVSVSPPRFAASSRARGEGSRASSANAMGIACAEATDVPICSTRHSRDDEAGLATSCIALRVASTTSGSGVHAPRSGREST